MRRNLTRWLIRGSAAALLLLPFSTQAQVLVPSSGSNTISCGTNETLLDPGGVSNYPNGANGFTVLEADGSAVINISGSYSVETSFDFIRIYDGVGTGGTLLQTYNGNGTANYTGAAGQTLTVQFTSDGSVTQSGFSFAITYTGACLPPPATLVPVTGSITVPCGTTVQLQDPGGAGNYPNSADGFAVLEAGFGATISINGPYDVETGFDNIRIYDGVGTGGTLLQTYTGAGTASYTGNPGQTLTVRFQSDGSVTDVGFDFAVTSTGPCVQPPVLVPFSGSNTVACGTNVTLRDHADLGNYSNNANGFTVLEAGAAGVINITGPYSTESCCDRVRIYDGVGTAGTILATFNGTGTANYTGAAGQTLTVQFTSDGSVVFSGFDFAVTYTGACTLPCTPPTATASSACNGANFDVVVDVTDLGDSPSVDVVVDGVTQTTLLVADLPFNATYGPYTAGSPIDVNFLHAVNPACDVNVTGLDIPALCNDDCSGALPISCGATVSGSNVGASNDVSCIGDFPNNPGVWYTFVGANSGDPLALAGTPGDQVTMSTCNQASYDTKITVFEGACPGICIGGNDDASGCSGFSSEFSFATTVGTVYNVLVSSYNTATGTFDLTMTCAPPCLPVPLNDDCGDAETLTVAAYGTGTPTVGDNTCAASAVTNPSCDGFANIQDVWFTFNSGAENEVLITANGLGMTDLNLVVYEGACGGPEVLCDDPFSPTSQFLTVTPGTDYYIQVYSDGPTGQGTFEISVELPPPPPANDLCGNAIPVSCNSITSGTTEFATFSDAPASCGTSLNTAGGVWYTVTGWDGQMTAALCGAPFDSKIGVFEGGCGALNCVVGEDDDFTNCGGNDPFVSWAATSGATYHIYVTGFGSSTGTFDLEVACGDDNAACAENAVQLEINTDGFGSETSFEITGLGATIPVVSGGGYGNNTTVSEDGCLPDGTYRLEVSDAGNNGITGGGYVLRDGNGNRIIDNAGNGDNFTSLSAMAPGRGFQLPVGPVTLYAPYCDKEDLSSTATIRCNPDAAVSAEFGVNNANSGYQWRFFDPNGSYVRNIFISHANPSDPGKPAGAGRATWLRFQSIVTLPLPQNILLNVQVRPRVNGTYGNFGPVCRLVVDDVAAGCPTTTLIQDVNNQNFSCGVQRVFGPFGNTISAQPVLGANRYRFRFEQIGDAFVRNIAIPGYTLTLNWGTLPLTPGASYNVFVQVSFDGGANYCPFGDPCVVDIISPPTASTRELSEATGAVLNMWPNPNRGDQLYLTISELPNEEMTVNVDIYDLFGKRVAARTLTAQGGMLNTVMSLDGQLASGMYMVNITAGDQLFTERLIIE